MSTINRFWRNDSGATSIEYSLIAALVGLVIIAGVTKLGTNLSNKFSVIANKVT